MKKQQHHLQQRRHRDGEESTPTSTSHSRGNGLVINHHIIERLFSGSPVKIKNPMDFFNEYCDKKHIHLSLNNSERKSNYWDDKFNIDWSTEKMRNAIKNKKLRHKVDVNIVRYDKTEKRRIDFLETMSEEKNREAYDDSDLPPLVTLADFDRAMSSGWSIRFLRPQEHGTVIDKNENNTDDDDDNPSKNHNDDHSSKQHSLSNIMFKLEEELQCSCGVNSYWTPANSQGFAPHYDDVDVFLLQLEGKKHWRLYTPPTKGDWLSRVSSEDYKPEELGKPILDIVLKKGEMLYMPRGTVHQGDTTMVGDDDGAKSHSLHATLSAFQMHTWADLIRETYDYRVEFAAANEVSLRHSLPLGWRTVMGSLVNPTMMGPFVAPLTAEQRVLRSELQKKMRGFFEEIHTALMGKDGILDKGVDAIARKVLERRQPVPLFTNENNNNNNNNNNTPTTVENPTQIRLTFKESVRFVMLTGEVRLYHCGGNSIICMGPKQDRHNMIAKWTDEKSDNKEDENPPSASSSSGYLRFDESFGPAIASILSKSPKWVTLSSLPELGFGGDDDDSTTSIPLEESRQMIDALLSTCCFEIRK